jgi:4-diphosphocytidyl-2-C-methyl-D-erythritol kinase
LDALTVFAPAKINLALKILRKRADGYHELQTILQKISLNDELELKLSPRQGILVTTDDPAIPGDQSNLAYRAAQALLQRTRIAAGVAIHIRKRIPAGAGLGGGSSDAAAVLTGLNKLLACKLTTSGLAELGLTLGADVPFFLYPQNTALAEGIGERLSPISLHQSFWALLVYPGFSVATAWAYRNYKILTNKINHISMRNSIRDIYQLLPLLENDLEQVVIKEHPEIQKIKDDLISAGAYGSLMSGSGSSVFGLFTDEEQARKAAATLTRLPRQKVFVVQIAAQD